MSTCSKRRYRRATTAPSPGGAAGCFDGCGGGGDGAAAEEEQRWYVSLHVAPDGGSVDTAYSLEVVGAPQAIAPEAGESRAGSLPAYGGVAYALDVALPHWRSTLLPADERPPAVPPAPDHPPPPVLPAPPTAPPAAPTPPLPPPAPPASPAPAGPPPAPPAPDAPPSPTTPPPAPPAAPPPSPSVPSPPAGPPSPPPPAAPPPTAPPPSAPPLLPPPALRAVALPLPMALRVALHVDGLSELSALGGALEVRLRREGCAAHFPPGGGGFDEGLLLLGIGGDAAVADGVAATAPSVRLSDPDPLEAADTYVALVPACSLLPGRYSLRVTTDCRRPRRPECSAAALRHLSLAYDLHAALLPSLLPSALPAAAAAGRDHRHAHNQSATIFGDGASAREPSLLSLELDVVDAAAPTGGGGGGGGGGLCLDFARGVRRLALDGGRLPDVRPQELPGLRAVRRGPRGEPRSAVKGFVAPSPSTPPASPPPAAPDDVAAEPPSPLADVYIRRGGCAAAEHYHYALRQPPTGAPGAAGVARRRAAAGGGCRRQRAARRRTA